MTSTEGTRKTARWAPPVGSEHDTHDVEPVSRSSRRTGRAIRAVLQRLWNDRRLGIVATLGLGVSWGLIAAWWTPRGPLTTGEALSSMAISMAIGLGAGLLMRSRWAMLLTPVAFAVAFEVGRLGVKWAHGR